jgi:hypothetical protein
MARKRSFVTSVVMTALAVLLFAFLVAALIERSSDDDDSQEVLPPNRVVVGELEDKLELVVAERNYPAQPFSAEGDPAEVNLPAVDLPFGGEIDPNVPIPGTSESREDLVGGSVEARIDLEHLDARDIARSEEDLDGDGTDETVATITLDPPSLDVFHAEHVENVDEDEGRARSFADVFFGDQDELQQDEVVAGAATFFQGLAQEDDELFDRARQNTQEAVSEIVEGLGFDEVVVQFSDPAELCPDPGDDPSDEALAEREECLGNYGYFTTVEER